jgi:mono/diheme cytochrome c family protein
MANPRRILRVTLKVLGVLLLLIGIAIGSLAGYASFKINRSYARVPLPPIARATTPEALQRGERLVHGVCLGCHEDAQGRAAGKPLDDYPKFLGTFYSGNLTHDPTAGIGAWSDGELARMVRYAVRRDGHLSRGMAPLSGLSDQDLAAVIGYLRSDAPELQPVSSHQPETSPSVLGNIVLALVFGVRLDDVVPPSGIVAPDRAVTAERGRYLAESVYDCINCHTEGFSGDKHAQPGRYSGGFEFPDKQGRLVYSANLTPDGETGIGSWTPEAFRRAVRDGINPEGYVLRPPMPRFRYLEDDELDAIAAFLKTVPPVAKTRKPGTVPRDKPSPAAPPEQLFSQLGCVLCHGEGAPFRDKINQCKGKPLAEVAAWILHPEKTKPGTQMPTFAELVSEPQAIALAGWVQTNVVR